MYNETSRAHIEGQPVPSYLKCTNYKAKWLNRICDSQDKSNFEKKKDNCASQLFNAFCLFSFSFTGQSGYAKFNLKALPTPPAPFVAGWPPVPRHEVRLRFPCTLQTLSICRPALPPFPVFQQISFSAK